MTPRSRVHVSAALFWAVSALLFACKKPLMGSGTRAIPIDGPSSLPPATSAREGSEVLRVQVDWHEENKNFTLADAVLETSGTPGLIRSSKTSDGMGSFRASLQNSRGETIAHASQGIGYDYRSIARSLSFRFPAPSDSVTFRLEAENESTGVMEKVFEQNLDMGKVKKSEASDKVEVKVIKAATGTSKVYVNVYAEGYTDDEASRSKFWRDAAKVSETLVSADFPGVASFEITAVFLPSATVFPVQPKARDRSAPAATTTALGLYYPYWYQMERWPMIVYPKDEGYFRQVIAAVPYDYPIALINSSSYFGMGNYKSLTAVPVDAERFNYLMLHEFGHFFGLNEEYDSGDTELAFASGMQEPWSPNITFNGDRRTVKWRRLMGQNGVDLYPGGYGGHSSGQGRRAYKPVQACMMASGGAFCPVCRAAIAERVAFDAGP